MSPYFSPTSAEIDRYKTGDGGRPPFDDSPEGHGGGGGDDDWSDPWAGPRERLHRVRFFIFSGLAADMVCFAVLIMLYYARQSGLVVNPQTHTVTELWRPVPPPPILYLNTLFLVLSGVAMEMARRNIFHEVDVLEEWLGLGRPALKRALPWLGVAFALGALFLIGQWAAWRQLAAEGFSFAQAPGAQASYYFFLLTGVHALHLATGLSAMLFCLLALGKLKRVELRQIAVDSTAWCWLFLTVAWLPLLLVLVRG